MPRKEISTDSFLTLPESWTGVFDTLYDESDFAVLSAEIERRFSAGPVFPKREEIFRALSRVTPRETRVVILGQDPYPTRGNAHGFSFSVGGGVKIPASLRTIFAELSRSADAWQKPPSGDLSKWAGEGVLMLNSILTVREDAPLSHARLGWEAFTRAILQHAQHESDCIVFMLWGSKAASIVDPILDTRKHFALRDSHPSPLAQNRLPAGKKFVGNNHFVEANRLLQSKGHAPIDWSL
jgi:uracil-DNA glycosylase